MTRRGSTRWTEKVNIQEQDLDGIEAALVQVMASQQGSRRMRIAAVQQVLALCCETAGHFSEQELLQQLGDYLLGEELQDRHPDKVTRSEYPFFSEWQLETRRKREVSYLMIGSYTGGNRDNGSSTRRKRSPYERAYLDTVGQGRTEASRERYVQATLPGPVQIYFLSGESTGYIAAAQPPL